MSKMIKVDRCVECPRFMNCTTIKMGRSVGTSSIHHDCPLEDYPEREDDDGNND